MHASRFFAGMVCTLLVFAVATYVMKGSALTTLIDTALAAVLLQIGYFMALIGLVWRQNRQMKPNALPSGTRAEQQTAFHAAPIKHP